MKAYMCLGCKPEFSDRILDGILKLNVPKKNIFSVFGLYDIVIQFTEIKDLEEFKERWFNPVRLIGAEEDLIVRTLTYIVISEGPSIAEEPFAFIFLTIEPKYLDTVQRSLLNIPNVLSADTVFGPHDVVCSVKATHLDDFKRLITKIQSDIPGIEGTLVAFSPRVQEYSHL